jgi:hypothetical protein
MSDPLCGRNEIQNGRSDPYYADGTIIESLPVSFGMSGYVKHHIAPNGFVGLSLGGFLAACSRVPLSDSP